MVGALDAGVRHIDTSFNYLRFASHRTLAREAHDLLPEFDISTKVGFFPDEDGRPVHHLTPELLRYAVATTVEDLGLEPTTILLHNPEVSLRGLNPVDAFERLQAACAVLEEMRTVGLCGQWGWSTWSPGPILSALGAAHGPFPAPAVVMVRAGLLVDPDGLDDADRLFTLLDVPAEGRWGMSPFGGDTRQKVWDEVDARVHIAGGTLCTKAQAAFRTAFKLPVVDRIAVGTENLTHLRELVMSSTLQVDEDTVSTYRGLLRSAQHQPAAQLAKVRP